MRSGPFEDPDPRARIRQSMVNRYRVQLSDGTDAEPKWRLLELWIGDRCKMLDAFLNAAHATNGGQKHNEERAAMRGELVSISPTAVTVQIDGQGTPSAFMPEDVHPILGRVRIRVGDRVQVDSEPV